MPALTLANAELRAQNVTASEVGALMGVHPYATPESIYDRLTAPAEQEPKTGEALELGSWFEEPILRYAEHRDQFRARLNERTFVHPTVRLCATPDAFVIRSRPGLFVPERALVEIKMSGRPDVWRELPPHVEWQARSQMACTGRDTVYVYALVGMRLLCFQVDRQRGSEAALLERVQRFWTENIVAGVRPEPAAPAGPFTFEGA